mmetsp:Transcript_24678/g.93328  ORF Transcript_24678/g.93328 Transcript_24678/m.93328 type:complete len:204 (-) Transcript_24678:634-1245(-)
MSDLAARAESTACAATALGPPSSRTRSGVNVEGWRQTSTSQPRPAPSSVTLKFASRRASATASPCLRPTTLAAAVTRWNHSEPPAPARRWVASSADSGRSANHRAEPSALTGRSGTDSRASLPARSRPPGPGREGSAASSPPAVPSAERGCWGASTGTSTSARSSPTRTPRASPRPSAARSADGSDAAFAPDRCSGADASGPR